MRDPQGVRDAFLLVRVNNEAAKERVHLIQQLGAVDLLAGLNTPRLLFGAVLLLLLYLLKRAGDLFL
jgi:hypothetical protein